MKIINGPRKGERGGVALCVCTNLFVKSWFRSTFSTVLSKYFGLFEGLDTIFLAFIRYSLLTIGWHLMLISLLNVFISKIYKINTFDISIISRYISSKIFDFHYKSSSEVINDIINKFVGYIIARNDIKHVRVIYSIS